MVTGNYNGIDLGQIDTLGQNLPELGNTMLTIIVHLVPYAIPLIAIYFAFHFVMGFIERR